MGLFKLTKQDKDYQALQDMLSPKEDQGEETTTTGILSKPDTKKEEDEESTFLSFFGNVFDRSKSQAEEISRLMQEEAERSALEVRLSRQTAGISRSLSPEVANKRYNESALSGPMKLAPRALQEPVPVDVEELETLKESIDNERQSAINRMLDNLFTSDSDTTVVTDDADGGAAPSGKGLMSKPYDADRMREINEPLGEGLVSPDAGILSPRLDGKDGDLAAYVRPFTVTEEELYSFATESFPDNPLAAGALLATIEAESAGGDTMLESGNYTKENALKVAYQGTYKTARKKEVEKIFNNPDLTYTDKDGNIRMTKEGQVKFFNIYYNDKYRGKDYKLGNTKEGDGFRFRGRGPIQLTGKNNYKKYGDMIGVDLVQNPHLVVTDKDVALAVTKAYMKDKGLNNVRSASQLRNIVGHADDEEATKAKARWKRAKEIQRKVTPLAPSTSLRPRSRPNNIMASN